MSLRQSLQPLFAKPGVFPFAIAITVLNLLGHLWLGFEQAWLVPIVALTTAYACELSTELAISGWRKARFRGGPVRCIAFLLPAHITGLAVGMLLYTNQRFMVVVFAVAVAVFSKVLLRVPVAQAPTGTTTHFMNPSNLGIALTLLLFSDWVGVAQPYQFTENVSGALDWILPLLIVCSGSYLNWRATGRFVLVLAWLAGFSLQAAARSWLSPQDLLTLLAPMTGMAFVLFTFYMVSDPMTTPRGAWAQVAFGLTTAGLYGLLTHAGIVFGLFFSLCLACAIRGTWMWLVASRSRFPFRSDLSTVRTTARRRSGAQRGQTGHPFHHGTIGHRRMALTEARPTMVGEGGVVPGGHRKRGAGQNEIAADHHAASPVSHRRS